MAWTMPQVIGRNIKERRESLGMTAKSLGEKMGAAFPKTGTNETKIIKAWPTSAVYMMEAGDRSMIADEVAALSQILDMSLVQMFTPPMEAKKVQAGDISIERSKVLTAGTQGKTEDRLLAYETELTESWVALKTMVTSLHDGVLPKVERINKDLRAWRESGTVTGEWKEKDNG